MTTDQITIKEYIENQLGEDKISQQMTLEEIAPL